MNDPDDPDLLAAEYVLGTLDAAERARVASRLASGDAALRQAVRAWEAMLAPLGAAAPEVEAPPAVYDALAARLFGAGAAPGGRDAAVLLLRGRLRRWQGAAVALAALAAALLVYAAAGPIHAPDGRGRLVAVLQREAGSPAMLVDIDVDARRLSVRPLGADAPAGRAYELWIIDPALATPRSLGMIPRRGDAEASLRAYDPTVIAGATYAVTLEPPGGSPTGLPSGAPVLAGRLSPPSS